MDESWVSVSSDSVVVNGDICCSPCMTLYSLAAPAVDEGIDRSCGILYVLPRHPASLASAYLV